jgi:hypothetical protein
MEGDICNTMELWQKTISNNYMYSSNDIVGVCSDCEHNVTNISTDVTDLSDIQILCFPRSTYRSTGKTASIIKLNTEVTLPENATISSSKHSRSYVLKGIAVSSIN